MTEIFYYQLNEEVSLTAAISRSVEIIGDPGVINGTAPETYVDVESLSVFSTIEPRHKDITNQIASKEPRLYREFKQIVLMKYLENV